MSSFNAGFGLLQKDQLSSVKLKIENMKIYRSVLTITCLLYFSCATEVKEEKVEDWSTYFNQIFTGDLAYQTTAFVEKHWRVVGNTGFDASIYEIARVLEENGFLLESDALPGDRLTYRIEKRPLTRPTWEPVNGQVLMDKEVLLDFRTNRNMIAINSYGTRSEGVIAEVIKVSSLEELKKRDVKGKIVFGEMSLYRLFQAAVVEQGAIGVMSYSNPSYLQPEKNTTSIQFRSIPLSEEHQSWGIALSYEAKEKLNAKLLEGKLVLKINLETKIYSSEELTVVANIKGDEKPDEQLVISAHVQEPGANDNASGVGVALEMAVLSAKLVSERKVNPKRTLTFLWGDEIISTRRYVTEDSVRKEKIKWGISLDMVGENTDLTGGSFLIEKMPDPSAIWTRGNDEHSEWGGEQMTLDDMRPHYLNDYVIHQFEKQGKVADWNVKTNPFEGGSDHVPFLDAEIPAVLFWHFTDQFYHTDNDRLDKVSKSTLKNVGVAALTSTFELVNADEETARRMIALIKDAAMWRLGEEVKQGKIAIETGSTVDLQLEILTTWQNWYLDAIETCSDLVDDRNLIKKELEGAAEEIKRATELYKSNLVSDQG